MHVKDIAARCNMDAGKLGKSFQEGNLALRDSHTNLGRVLRALACHYIFEEVSPDIFANNRISVALDTGKSVADLINK